MAWILRTFAPNGTARTWGPGVQYGRECVLVTNYGKKVAQVVLVPKEWEAAANEKEVKK